MRAILFNLSLLGFIVTGFAQITEIPWTNYTPLTWNDFKGSINPNSEMSAETFSGITYEASIRSNSERIVLEIEVHAYYDKNKSWRKPGNLTTALLQHEQVHFDITELYARLLRKNYAEYAYPERVDQDLLDMLFRQNQQRLDSVQMQYDLDTDHSRFEEGQKLWEQFISDSIMRFENYSESKVKIIVNLKD